MVYNRKPKRMSKRRLMRKKRRFNISKPKPYQTKFVRVTRWSNNDSVTNVHYVIPGNNTLSSGTACTLFKLNQTSGFGELVNLFDNYCIRKVLYRWVLNRDPSQNTAASAGSAGLFPRLNWVHDFNDSVAISRLQMMQHPRMREVYFTESFQKTRWYSLNPASLVQLYEATAATAFKPSWGQFVDTNDNDMSHYGIKFTWDQLYAGMSIYLEAKLIIDCKGIS